MKKRIFRAPLLLMVLSALLAGFEVGDTIELIQFLNGRSGPKFRISGPVIDHNVQFVVPKGTIVKIDEVRRLPSGNDGLRVTIESGDHKGKKDIWIYYNKKNPGVKKVEPVPAPAPDPEPPAPLAPGDQGVTTQEMPAVPGQPTGQAQRPPGLHQPFVGNPDLAQLPPEPPLTPATLAEINRVIPSSNIDLPGAIACYHDISKVLVSGDRADYPPGYVATPGFKGNKTGAYVFKKDAAYFVEGAVPETPNMNNALVQYFASSEEELLRTAPELKNATSSLDDRAKAFLTMQLRNRLFTLFQSARMSARIYAIPEALRGKSAFTEEDERKLLSVTQATRTPDFLNGSWVKPLSAAELPELQKLKAEAAQKISKGQNFIPDFDQLKLILRAQQANQDHELATLVMEIQQRVAVESQLALRELDPARINSAFSTCSKIQSEAQVSRLSEMLAKGLAEFREELRRGPRSPDLPPDDAGAGAAK